MDGSLADHTTQMNNYTGYSMRDAMVSLHMTHQGHDQQIDDDDDAQSPGHRNRYQKNGGFGMQSVDAPEKPLTTSVEPTRVFCETAEILLPVPRNDAMNLFMSWPHREKLRRLDFASLLDAFGRSLKRSSPPAPEDLPPAFIAALCKILPDNSKGWVCCFCAKPCGAKVTWQKHLAHDRLLGIQTILAVEDVIQFSSTKVLGVALLWAFGALQVRNGEVQFERIKNVGKVLSAAGIEQSAVDELVMNPGTSSTGGVNSGGLTPANSVALNRYNTGSASANLRTLGGILPSHLQHSHSNNGMPHAMQPHHHMHHPHQALPSHMLHHPLSSNGSATSRLPNSINTPASLVAMRGVTPMSGVMTTPRVMTSHHPPTTTSTATTTTNTTTAGNGAFLPSPHSSTLSPPMFTGSNSNASYHLGNQHDVTIPSQHQMQTSIVHTLNQPNSSSFLSATATPSNMPELPLNGGSGNLQSLHQNSSFSRYTNVQHHQPYPPQPSQIVASPLPANSTNTSSHGMSSYVASPTTAIASALTSNAHAVSMPYQQQVHHAGITSLSHSASVNPSANMNPVRELHATIPSLKLPAKPKSCTLHISINTDDFTPLLSFSLQDCQGAMMKPLNVSNENLMHQTAQSASNSVLSQLLINMQQKSNMSNVAIPPPNHAPSPSVKTVTSTPALSLTAASRSLEEPLIQSPNLVVSQMNHQHSHIHHRLSSENDAEADLDVLAAPILLPSLKKEHTANTTHLNTSSAVNNPQPSIQNNDNNDSRLIKSEHPSAKSSNLNGISPCDDDVDMDICAGSSSLIDVKKASTSTHAHKSECLLANNINVETTNSFSPLDEFALRQATCQTALPPLPPHHAALHQELLSQIPSSLLSSTDPLESNKAWLVFQELAAGLAVQQLREHALTCVRNFEKHRDTLSVLVAYVSRIVEVLASHLEEAKAERRAAIASLAQVKLSLIEKIAVSRLPSAADVVVSSSSFLTEGSNGELDISDLPNDVQIDPRALLECQRIARHARFADAAVHHISMEFQSFSELVSSYESHLNQAEQRLAQAKNALSIQLRGVDLLANNFVPSLPPTLESVSAVTNLSTKNHSEHLQPNKSDTDVDIETDYQYGNFNNVNNNLSNNSINMTVKNSKLSTNSNNNNGTNNNNSHNTFGISTAAVNSVASNYQNSSSSSMTLPPPATTIKHNNHNSSNNTKSTSLTAALAAAAALCSRMVTSSQSSSDNNNSQNNLINTITTLTSEDEIGQFRNEIQKVDSVSTSTFFDERRHASSMVYGVVDRTSSSANQTGNEINNSVLHDPYIPHQQQQSPSVAYDSRFPPQQQHPLYSNIVQHQQHQSSYSHQYSSYYQQQQQQQQPGGNFTHGGHVHHQHHLVNQNGGGGHTTYNSNSVYHHHPSESNVASTMYSQQQQQQAYAYQQHYQQSSYYLPQQQQPQVIAGQSPFVQQPYSPLTSAAGFNPHASLPPPAPSPIGSLSRAQTINTTKQQFSPTNARVGMQANHSSSTLTSQQQQHQSGLFNSSPTSPHLTCSNSAITSVSSNINNNNNNSIINNHVVNTSSNHNRSSPLISVQTAPAQLSSKSNIFNNNINTATNTGSSSAHNTPPAVASDNNNSNNINSTRTSTGSTNTTLSKLKNSSSLAAAAAAVAAAAQVTLGGHGNSLLLNRSQSTNSTSNKNSNNNNINSNSQFAQFCQNNSNSNLSSPVSSNFNNNNNSASSLMVNRGGLNIDSRAASIKASAAAAALSVGNDT